MTVEGSTWWERRVDWLVAVLIVVAAFVGIGILDDRTRRAMKL